MFLPTSSLEPEFMAPLFFQDTLVEFPSLLSNQASIHSSSSSSLSHKYATVFLAEQYVIRYSWDLPSLSEYHRQYWSWSELFNGLLWPLGYLSFENMKLLLLVLISVCMSPPLFRIRLYKDYMHNLWKD